MCHYQARLGAGVVYARQASLPVVSIESSHKTTYAGFSTGRAHQNFAFGSQGCEGDVRQGFDIAHGGIPNHFAGDGVQRNQV
jgi:hypothetical protein